MRIWLSGLGLLGNAIRDALEARSIEFISTSRGQLDITDVGQLVRFWDQRGPFTHILNCSAYTQVDLAQKLPAETYRANALGPAFLGWLAAQKGAQIVHFSTDYVFGGTSTQPYREGDRENPQTVYGYSKWEGEKNLLNALPSACILRTSWLFGRGGNHFVSTILQKIQQGKELRIVADQCGRPTYTKDLAEIALEALDWKGVYHFANAGVVNWYGFAQEIVKQTGARPGTIIPILSSERSSLAPRPFYSVLCTEKVEKRLRRQIRPWKEGLIEYLEENHASL